MAKRVDANQTEIVAALRGVGASVLSLASVGKGCPDLLVRYAPRAWFGDGLYLLEVKTEKGRLTPDQVEFHRCWPVTVVYNVNEALRAVGAIGREDEQ